MNVQKPFWTRKQLFLVIVMVMRLFHLQTIAETAEDYNDINKTAVADIITSEDNKLFPTRSVHDYLWGYTEPVAEQMETAFPGTFDDTTFGLYYLVNKLFSLILCSVLVFFTSFTGQNSEKQ